MLRKAGFAAVMGVGTSGAIWTISTKHHTVHVDTKEEKPRTLYHPMGRRVIRDTEGTVFSTGFHLWGGPYNFRGMYDDVEEGRWYDVTVRGFDCPRFHLYRTIIDAKETDSPCMGNLDPVKDAVKEITPVGNSFKTSD